MINMFKKDLKDYVLEILKKNMELEKDQDYIFGN